MCIIHSIIFSKHIINYADGTAFHSEKLVSTGYNIRSDEMDYFNDCNCSNSSGCHHHSNNCPWPWQCSSNCTGSCICNCTGEGLIVVRVLGYTESGFTYLITQGGNEVERAVSFRAPGLDIIDVFPFARPRTISGAISRNGTPIEGGENFDVVHRQGSGTYRVIYKKTFTMVNEKPQVQIIPDPSNCTGPCNCCTASQSSTTISGTIRANGDVLSGTTLPDGSLAFEVVKISGTSGLYSVRFKPELNISLLLDAGLTIRVINLPASSNNCCSCCCNNACVNQDIIGQGVEKLNVDKTGFLYNTFVETLADPHINTDLPVTFTAIVIIG